MQKEKYFQNSYTQNPKSGAYQIAVSLDDYNDVYDDWDPAPFKKRDIELEFQDYIVDSSDDIPLKYDIELLLYVPGHRKDSKKEKLLKIAFDNHFIFLRERLLKEGISDGRKAVSYVFMAFVFLTMGTLSLRFIENNVVLEIFNEGLVIGGWVFLWEAFTLLAFDLRRIKKNLRKYNRFLKANVIFSYKATEQ